MTDWITLLFLKCETHNGTGTTFTAYSGGTVTLRYETTNQKWEVISSHNGHTEGCLGQYTSHNTGSTERRKL